MNINSYNNAMSLLIERNFNKLWIDKVIHTGSTHIISILPAFKIKSNNILRSQQFSPKTSVTNWAMCLPISDNEQCKVDKILIENNMVYLIDNDNKVTPKIHIFTV